MFCTECGAEIKEGETFCSNCGKELPKAKAIATNLLKKGTGEQNKLGMVAGAAIVFSTFFPFVSVSFLGTKVSANLLDGPDGYILMVIALLGIFFSYKGKEILIAITGGISFIFFLIENASMKSGNDLEKWAKSLMEKKFGYYLLLLGSLALLATGIISIIKKKKQEA